LFKEDKTTVYWIGIIFFSLSISMFCIATFQAIFRTAFPLMIEIQLEGSAVLNPAIPSLIVAIIFLIVGLFVMKVGMNRGKHQTK